jgi:hypothetical protein
MIVPAEKDANSLYINVLQKRTVRADRPDTSGIEKMRPISEHSWCGSNPGNGWRESGSATYIARPGSCISRPERQAVLMHQEESPDFELLKADIASRLRSACAHFSDRDFADLVHQIASIEVKYGRNPLTPPTDAR